jgi:hypothetical protein
MKLVLNFKDFKEEEKYNYSRMMKLFLQPNDIASLTGF